MDKFVIRKRKVEEGDATEAKKVKRLGITGT